MTEKQNMMKHIPNALTVGRLIMTVILLGLILYAPKTGQDKPGNLLLGVWILFIVTGLTDIADGYLARKFEVTSKFGRTMDPLADKFLVCGAYFCFAWVGQPLLKCFAFSELTLSIIQWGTVLALNNLGPEAAIPTAFFVFACIITASIMTEIWKSRGAFVGNK